MWKWQREGSRERMDVSPEIAVVRRSLRQYASRDIRAEGLGQAQFERVLESGQITTACLAEFRGNVLLQRSVVGKEASITMGFACSPLALRALSTTRICKTRKWFLLGHADEYTGCQYQ